MSEQEPLSHFNVGVWLDCLPTALLIRAQIEGERRAKLQAKAEDFVRRYPNGMNVKPPKRALKKPLFNLIPTWYERLYGENE